MAESVRRTFVTIEVEMGFDDEWHKVGLEAPPESAETLLAEIKDESHGSITAFIRDWSVDDFVTVRIEVAHNEDGQTTRTVATWTQ